MHVRKDTSDVRDYAIRLHCKMAPCCLGCKGKMAWQHMDKTVYGMT